MPEEFKPGCQRPLLKKTPAATVVNQESMVKEAIPSMVKVGKPAPDFAAPAYFQGKFANYNLSEFKGKWVLLCFYPGDFTFV